MCPGREQPAFSQGCSYTAGDPLGLAYRVILCGYRRAELVGFRWAGADLDRRVLTVARPIVQLGGRLVEEPTAKSRAGDRLVFLDAETAELLKAHRKAQLADRLRAGEAWQDNDLVFSQLDRRPWLPDHVSKRFKRLAREAGVPAVKLHEAGRHTGNSLMRDAGIDQETRMRQIGHAGKEINDRYTHTLITAHQAAAEQTAALVRRSAGHHDPHVCSQMFPRGASGTAADRPVTASCQVRCGGAGGARTHDRRIMSPARQQPSSGQLTWADVLSRNHDLADLGTYLA